MPSREEFPTGKVEGALSDNIGWHFGTIVQGRGRNNIACKFCGRVIVGGITQLKDHLAHV